MKVLKQRNWAGRAGVALGVVVALGCAPVQVVAQEAPVVAEPLGEVEPLAPITLTYGKQTTMTVTATGSAQEQELKAEGLPEGLVFDQAAGTIAGVPKGNVGAYAVKFVDAAGGVVSEWAFELQPARLSYQVIRTPRGVVPDPKDAVVNVDDIAPNAKFEWSTTPDVSAVGSVNATFMVSYEGANYPDSVNVTVKVDEPEPQVVESTWDTVTVDAGTQIAVAPPKAAEGGASYQVVGATRGGAAVDSWWAQVTSAGVVLLSPESDEPAGLVNLVVERANEAGTVTGRFTVPVEIKHPPMNAGWGMSYADTPAKVGRAATSFAPLFAKEGLAERPAPEGMTFTLGEGAPAGASVDLATGAVTFTHATEGTIAVPVVGRFTDGTTVTGQARFKVEPLGASDTAHLSYAPASARNGDSVRVPVVGNVPAGTEFVLRDASPGWIAAVDAATGLVTASALNATAGLELTVLAIFADGTSTELPLAISLNKQATLASGVDLAWEPTAAYVGTTARSTQQATVPEGTTFTLADRGTIPAEFGAVTVDATTGAVSISVPQDAAVGHAYTAEVTATFADASTATAPVTFTIAAQEAAVPGEALTGGLGDWAPEVTFDLDETTVPDGWTVEVDEDTGLYRIDVPRFEEAGDHVVAVNVNTPNGVETAYIKVTVDGDDAVAGSSPLELGLLITMIVGFFAGIAAAVAVATQGTRSFIPQGFRG